MGNEKKVADVRVSMLAALVFLAAFAASDGLAQCVAPDEVGQLGVSKSGTDAILRWELPGNASASELVRGDLRTGRVNVIGIGQSCLGTGLAGYPAEYTESVNPPVGTGYWYLVRATSDCGAGPWGVERLTGFDAVRVTECGCQPDFVNPNRYVASSVSVSDRRTCLEWEKKSGDTGNVLHSYRATDDFFSLQLNNPAPGWVSQVNGERYGDHSDWRLPKSSGPLSNPTGDPPELESILLTPCPAATYNDITPCIDPVFGFFPPNAGPDCPDGYADCRKPQFWSSSTVHGQTNYGWTVNFVDGTWSDLNNRRFSQWSFRAVRGTLYGQ